MKIVVTGANGFVGAGLCRYLHNLGHQVIAIGRQAVPNANLLAYASYLQVDITQPLACFEADVCIHAAALASDSSGYDSLFLNNVKGTENVLNAAKNCPYFIFISSSSIYNFGDQPAVETDAILNKGLTPYGQTKLLAEKLVEKHIAHGQKRLILRPRAIYGIGDRLLLPRLFKLVKWQTIFCPVGSAVHTSLLHINNLAYSVELFLSQENPQSLQVLNVADDTVYNLKDITLKILNTVEGKSLRVVNISPAVLKKLFFINSKIPFSDHLSPLAFKTITETSVLSLERIKKTLGYKPLYAFDNTYIETIDWIKNMGGKKFYLDNISQAPWILNNPGHLIK